MGFARFFLIGGEKLWRTIENENEASSRKRGGVRTAGLTSGWTGCRSKEDGSNMSFRLPLAVPLTLLCAGFLLSTTSCDFSSGGSSSNNGLNAGPGTSPGSGGGDCFESPILQSAEGLDTEICPGEFVTLRGVNFSADPENPLDPYPYTWQFQGKRSI